jgi:hypothetical protein
MRQNGSVIVIALVLIAYGLYTTWLMVQYQSGWFLLWAVPCVAGGVGLIMSRAWSRYVLYFVAFCTVAGWAVVLALFWPNLALSAIVKLVALGLGLILFSVWATVVVNRHFRKNDAQI